ncbi:hypothetical protein U9M48_010108 [Paspalum notatum var. saurae]|uniref:Uncharacterized protein n=1 Tax=Paspalum notatum var. saurae TaxID=547442 RepID=A0AAQ3SSL6_PASNO
MYGFEFRPRILSAELERVGCAPRVLSPAGARRRSGEWERLRATEWGNRGKEATRFLDKAGAYAIVRSTPNSAEYGEIQTYKASIMTALDRLKP